MRPASTFCCGCPVKAGLVGVLIIHLLLCVLVVGCGVTGLVLMKSVFANINQWAELGFVLWFLCGIPIILAGLHGVYAHVEGNVRVYFYYTAVGGLVNVWVLLIAFLVEDTCSEFTSIEPEFPQEYGDAFICGITRVVGYLIAAVFISVQVYIMFIIWSACEQLEHSKSGPELWDLLSDKERSFILQIGGRQGEHQSSLWWPCSWYPCTMVYDIVFTFLGINKPQSRRGYYGGVYGGSSQYGYGGSSQYGSRGGAYGGLVDGGRWSGAMYDEPFHGGYTGVDSAEFRAFAHAVPPVPGAHPPSDPYSNLSQNGKREA